MCIDFFLEHKLARSIHRTQDDREISSDFWNGARARSNKRDVCRVGFEQNQVLRWQLRKRSRDVVNGSVCRFRYGIDAVCHDAAIADKFPVIRYKKAMTIGAEMSGLIKYRDDNDGVARLLRDCREIRRRIRRCR